MPKKTVKKAQKMSTDTKDALPDCPKCNNSDHVKLLNADIFGCSQHNLTFKKPE